MNSARLAALSLSAVVIIFVAVLVITANEMSQVKISGKAFLHGQEVPEAFVALRAFKTRNGEIGEFGPKKAAFKVSLVRAQAPNASPEKKLTLNDTLDQLRAEYKVRDPLSTLSPLIPSYFNAQTDSRRMGIGTPQMLHILKSNGESFEVELAPFEGARQQIGFFGLLQRNAEQLLILISGQVSDQDLTDISPLIAAAS